ncbi:ParB/RepB/Spo0J family partition protein [Trichocoleus sp. FACHB-262]|uniref:ParB/RepB/Spo0J family partition protein n=1 Tax=Trichocoleus sp. FACHB-262 TaxID=2692869 RepID=UPI001683F211|nr:ParB/RepB/Spo0J family partition protein [Trichocoleus sp. FACHB-262]MBD2121052.1 ParB/RepB/Spo0J family partition protein [Trichocoleus sp. FACHB-262]
MVKRKSGLGINPFEVELGIFTPTESTTKVQSSTEQSLIELSRIILSQQQPRRYFDPDKMQHLIQSVQEHGILEPLLVRPLSANNYELVAGERRYRAAQAVGLAHVPVVVRELTDPEALQLALIENLQREDLNPVEETEGVINLLALELKVHTQEVPSLLHRLAKSSDNVVGNEQQAQIQLIENVFQSVGRMTWESFSSHRLPLLNLPNTILEALRQGQIEYTKARAIARLKDETQRQALLEAAIADNLSLAQIRERIQASPAATPKTPSLKERMGDATRRLQKAKIWNDSKKQKQLEKLLAQIESLLQEGPE